MFKIGQKVVCKNTYSQTGIVMGIKKGSIYTIEDIITCPDCGDVKLLLNTSSPSLKTCTKCYYSSLPNNAYMSSRFEPLQYDIISNKDIIKEIMTEKLDVKIHIEETVLI